MIESNELRLGNYVIDGDEVVILNDNYTLFKALINVDRGIGIKPIPLTEEWFIKLGFQLFGNDDPLDRYWTTNILKGSIEELSLKYTLSGIKIKYVHQLQNLYFALTGVELELSSNN
jgi:hypothetical protein